MKTKIEQITFPKRGDKKVFVGISGGVDSAALAHLSKKHYGDITGIYIDHGQNHSKIMEESAISISENLSFNLDIYRINPSKKNATETELRELRFEVFSREVLDKGNILLLGHHSNDRIETFFINLLRGTRLKGLRSITPSNGNVHRPLIDITKEEIMRHVKENNISSEEDPSNKEEKIIRNWIRNQILPLLSTRANRGLTSTIENISKEIIELHSRDDEVNRYIKSTKGYIELPLALVSQEGIREQNILINFLERIKREGIEMRNIDNLYSTIHTGSENEIFFNWKASRSNGLLVLVNSELWPHEIFFDTSKKELSWNNFYFKTDAKVQISNNWNFVADQNKIKGKIHIRRMKDGDVIETSSGTQKTSELLRAGGYSNSIRSIWPIFSDEEKIVWIPGIRTSSSVYLENSSLNSICVSCELAYNKTK